MVHVGLVLVLLVGVNFHASLAASVASGGSGRPVAFLDTAQNSGRESSQQELRSELAEARLRTKIEQLKNLVHEGFGRLLREVRHASESANTLQGLRAQLANETAEVATEPDAERRLRGRGEVAEKDVVALRAKLQADRNTTAQQNQTIANDKRTQARLQGELASIAKTVEDEKRSTAILEGNLTQDVASQGRLQRVQQRDRVSLLEQIARLQEDVQEAHDNSTRAIALSQKSEVRIQSDLRSARSQLDEMESRLKVSQELDRSTTEKGRVLEGQLADLNQSLVKVAANDEKELHDTKVAAGEKIGALENQTSALAAELQLVQTKESQAHEKTTKHKEAALQKEDAAFKESQRSQELKDSLADARKALESSNKEVEQLQATTSQLLSARKGMASQLQVIANRAKEWHAKVQQLDVSVRKNKDDAAAAQQEEQNLTAMAQQLSERSGRAKFLNSDLERLRTAVRENATRFARLAKQMETLRDQKDHDALELEEVQKASDAWRSHADALSAALRETLRRVAEAEKRRDSSQARLSQGRTQEEESFEQVAELQRQNEALNASAEEAKAAESNSAVEAEVLKAMWAEVQSTHSKEKAVDHQAWVAGEQKLLQARRDEALAESLTSNLNTELKHTEALLTEEQRHKLGLPNASAASASAKGVAQTNAAKAVAGEPRRAVDSADQLLASVGAN